MSSPITISARIRDDGNIHAALDAMAKEWGRLERLLYVEQFARGELDRDQKNTLKRNWLKKHRLTSMQFNGLDRQLGGKMKALKDCVELAKESLKNKIARVKRDIEDGKKSPSTLHQKKRRLYNLTQKLRKLETRKETSMCFGSRELFRSQFHLKENGLSGHEEWKHKWGQARNNQFLCLGMAAAPNGNSSCFFTEIVETHKGVAGKMTIRSFSGLPSITLPIEFTYNAQHIISAINAKSAITIGFTERAPSGMSTPPWNG